MIPYPELSSWMHTRFEVPKETIEQKFKRWENQPKSVRALEAVLSRIIIRGKIVSPPMRWTLFKVVRSFSCAFFKVFNRLRVFGLENVPKTGCIFYLNHPGSYDPLILMAAFPQPFGAFIAWGNGWFSDFFEDLYGFLSLRGGKDRGKHMVEKMVRQILKKNRYFAIWPEGHPNHKDEVEYGFPGVIRLYATINANENRLPLVPVLLRGSGIYTPEKEVRTNPIEVHFLKPFFINREWLKHPDQGGKTPEELVNSMMMILAHKFGQTELATNRLMQNKIPVKNKFSIEEIQKNIIPIPDLQQIPN